MDPGRLFSPPDWLPFANVRKNTGGIKTCAFRRKCEEMPSRIVFASLGLYPSSPTAQLDQIRDQVGAVAIFSFRWRL